MNTTKKLKCIKILRYANYIYVYYMSFSSIYSFHVTLEYLCDKAHYNGHQQCNEKGVPFLVLGLTDNLLPISEFVSQKTGETHWETSGFWIGHYSEENEIESTKEVIECQCRPYEPTQAMGRNLMWTVLVRFFKELDRDPITLGISNLLRSEGKYLD